jgi:4-hydroxy-tetrahydrodipicolinate reductase
MSNIRIIIAGPRGNMGREACKLIHETEHFELVAAIDRKEEYTYVRDMEGLPPLDAPVYTDAEKCVKEVAADVFLDLTNPETGKKHIALALQYGLRSVIGTTGFTEEEINELRQTTEEAEIGAIIAPNFAIGAILMMKFAKMAAHYFQDVEIIELHHDRKLDAPSGTALKTAEMIKEVRTAKEQGHPSEKEMLPGARGANVDGMHIHSVRLPGLVAHQQVIFGGDGQILTVKHDSFNRASFMSGVKLSIEQVMKLQTLVYGLENIIE